MIEVRDLKKNYGDFPAVKGISFDIRKGQITGLLGPNGAGKTTTMRMITGYLKPTDGGIIIDGIAIDEDQISAKRKIGYLPESAPLYSEMLVHDYLVYVAGMHSLENPAERVRETARLCGLSDVMHKSISELSKGYRQRVGLAHAMIHDPEILILDEPTSGLDPNQIVEIRKLIREIGKTKTVILSTHILPEVEATCDRVIIINQGAIVADGATSELQQGIGRSREYFVEVSGPASFSDFDSLLRQVQGIVTVNEQPCSDGHFSASVFANPGSDPRAAFASSIIQKGWSLFELRSEQDTLEKVFRDLTIGGN